MNQKSIEETLNSILDTLQKKLSIEMIKKKVPENDIVMEDEEFDMEYQ